MEDVLHKWVIKTPFIMLRKTFESYCPTYRTTISFIFIAFLCFLILFSISKWPNYLLLVQMWMALFPGLYWMSLLFGAGIFIGTYLLMKNTVSDNRIDRSYFLKRFCLGQLILIVLTIKIFITLFTSSDNIAVFLVSVLTEEYKTSAYLFSYAIGDYIINLWNFRKNGYPAPYQKETNPIIEGFD